MRKNPFSDLRSEDYAVIASARCNGENVRIKIVNSCG